MYRKIKVLVLDDSPVFREFLTRGFAGDTEIQVVAKAEDPFDAAEKIERYQPDVITCDVEMPKMDGIEFIRQLLPQHPVPIIVVSSLGSAIFDALNAGAVDFLTKPNLAQEHAAERFIRDLIHKVKAVYTAKVMPASEFKGVPADTVSAPGLQADEGRLIAIGASTGGTEAIFQLLRHLPSHLPGMVIVQHIPPTFSRLFAERLDTQTGFRVVEGKTGEWVSPGKVIIAPGDQHMRVVKAGNRFKVEVFHGEKVNGHCPSVDVLFDSVAKVCGDKAIGVILTGMGYDGAKGLLGMRRRGARTLGQDEHSSVVYGMPKAAYEVGAVERQASLSQLPAEISRMMR